MKAGTVLLLETQLPTFILDWHLENIHMYMYQYQQLYCPHHRQFL